MVMAVTKRKNQKGLTIVEGLVSLAVITISAVAVTKILFQGQEVNKRSQVQQETIGVVTDVINRGKLVLLDTKDENSRRTRGLCSLLVPENAQPGVVPIYVDLSRPVGSRADWNNAFNPEWRISAYSNQNGRVTISLAPTDRNLYVGKSGLVADSLKVNLKVAPRIIDPNRSASALFNEVSEGTRRFDAKKMVYFLEVDSSYQLKIDGQDFNKEETTKEIVSVIDVGGCDYRAPAGRNLTLSPAGTGLGDPTNSTIYNDTEFSKFSRSAFDIAISNTAVTRGKYEGGRLSADRAHNLAGACSENRYRCPKNRGTRSYNGTIDISSTINYHPRNRYGQQAINTVKIVPSLRLMDETGRNFLAGKGAGVELYGNNGVRYVRNPQGYMRAVDEDREILQVGQDQIRLVTRITNTGNLCSQMCDADNKSARVLTPVIDVLMPDLIDPETRAAAMESGEATTKMGCTMCYVKSCSRVGIATFGPIATMPPEPLDSVMPECALEQTSEVRRSLPFRQHTHIVNGCVAATVSTTGLIYSRVDCNRALPVMCFAYGEYTLARNLDRTLINVPYSQATTACRALGAESVPVAQLNEAFLQDGSPTTSLDSIPVANSRYVYTNMAKVGSFIAPQGDDDTAFAAETLKRRIPNINGVQFWVALTAQDRHLLAQPPIAYTGNAVSDQHAIYYGPAGNFVHTRIAGGVESFVTPASSGNAAILMHNLKFKGLVKARTTQARSFEFLCMRKSDRSFYLTSGRSSSDFNNGGAACEATQGLFVAPHSPYAWADAMLKVQSNGTHLAFPGNVENRAGVWVALKDNFEIARQGELAKLASRPAGNRSRTLVNRDGIYILREGNEIIEVTVPATTPGGTPTKEWRPNPQLAPMQACWNYTTSAIELMTNCSSGLKRIMKADLEHPIYSLYWVLQKDGFRLSRYEFIDIGE